jgi:hypothetical protein
MTNLGFWDVIVSTAPPTPPDLPLHYLHHTLYASLSLSLSLFLSFLSLRLLADLTQTVLNQVRRCWLTVDIQLSTDPCPPLTLSIGSSHELHVAARGGVIRRIPLISAPASKRRILIKEGMHQDAPRPSSIFLSFFFIFLHFYFSFRFLSGQCLYFISSSSFVFFLLICNSFSI